MKELRVLVYLPPILAALLLHWAGHSATVAAHDEPPFGAPSSMLTAEQIAQQQQQQQQQQQATKGGGGGGDSDDLLLLSDDEVLHHGKILRDLRHANKAEVEELIDNNPVLQEIVLKRIQAQLERQHQAKYYNKAKPKPFAGNHHQVDQQQQQLQLDIDELEDEDELAEVDKKKYDSLKVKLKSNAAKIFKMGSGFKEKVDALKRKYRNKTKEIEHQYKVQYEKEKEKEYEIMGKYKVIEKEPAGGKYKAYEKDKEKQFAKVPKFYVDVSH